jgi:hypothetical protein
MQRFFASSAGGNLMADRFDVALGIRLKPPIREQIRRIAEEEGNTEAAVLRRAVAAGLAVIAGTVTAGSPADKVTA